VYYIDDLLMVVRSRQGKHRGVELDLFVVDIRVGGRACEIGLSHRELYGEVVSRHFVGRTQDA
jgi:hypothetical protein